jgi:hypothetical protein
MIFDPDSFLYLELEESSTEYVIIPAGTHAAFIESQEIKSGISDKGYKWYLLETKWCITDPAVLEEMQRKTVYITQRIFLEIDPLSGKLVTGKGRNWQLGRLRAAVGKPKGPLADLVGCNARIEVKHRLWEGKLQEDVRSVTAG